MPHRLEAQLIRYLTDAHSIEVQALAQLKTAPASAGDPEVAEAFREHLAETEGHERLVRELLEERGARPSRLKDSVMSVGGKGFVLFARLQPDTPGKLLAHALSYEALEIASYALLARVADRVGAPDVSGIARQICDEERTMMHRLEACLDRAADASLETRGGDVKKRLRKYLADAHAIEKQSAELLSRATGFVDGGLAALYESHLADTHEHEQLVEARLQGLGGDASTLKDAAMRFGATNWAAFFRTHPDTPAKLTAFAYAFEHLEIGGYEQLRRVADRAGDRDTSELAARILLDERSAANRIAEHFDDVVATTVERLLSS
ncbi:MAG: DUF892 family protein [Actinobacteria bacterium]|nr:DUF892 family protein [Actinomycetota bacterium]